MMRRFVRRTEATAAIEFALLTPVYLLMVCGLIAYGLYFGAAHSLQQLTADAARTAVAGLSSAERANLVSRFIERNAGQYLLIDAQALTADMGEQPADPSQYRVTLRYDASNLPIWNLGVPLPGRIISFTSTIRHGGV